MTSANLDSLDNPRGKLFEFGAKNLGDAELVSLLLGGGGTSALDLARDLLRRFDGLAGLFSADARQIARVPRVGPAKSAALAAIGELGNRRLYAEVKNRDVLSCSQATREYLLARFRHCRSEIFSCVFLTNRHHILKLDEMFRGTIDATVIYPREVVERCIAHNAAAVILVHNHPSGNPEPSQADIVITRKLRAALETIDVRVLDHLIVGAASVISMAERGLM
ncbi:MAG: DNA repair protein RadC [Gammaproteobacteria bacterium]|nr:DNA repair protein RadC [Gammaproteobacteria bacterium]